MRLVGCRCYGQHSHENESRTEIRREPFIRAVLVLDKTCSYKWYSSRLIFPRINGPNIVAPGKDGGDEDQVTFIIEMVEEHQHLSQ